MNNWLSRIKEKKRIAGMTNDELAAASGIPQGTLNKILSGVSDDPKLSTLTALANVFSVSLDYIAFGEEGELHITEEESSLLRCFRELDMHGKELVRTVAMMEHDRVAEAARTSKILTPTKRYDFSSDRSRKTTADSSTSLPIYDLPVSAGRGALLDGSGTDFITVTSGGATKEADFALRVSGDSMEPDYSDGDILLVEGAEDIRLGETGIFTMGGDGYVKKRGEGKLISLNPEYEPIEMNASIWCNGRVIGKLRPEWMQ